MQVIELSVDFTPYLSLRWCDGMRSCPKRGRNSQGIDSLLLPPASLVTMPVEFTVMQPTKGNGEPVADLAPHRARLGVFDVVRI